MYRKSFLVYPIVFELFHFLLSRTTYHEEEDSLVAPLEDLLWFLYFFGDLPISLCTCVIYHRTREELLYQLNILKSLILALVVEFRGVEFNFSTNDYLHFSPFCFKDRALAVVPIDSPQNMQKNTVTIIIHFFWGHELLIKQKSNARLLNNVDVLIIYQRDMNDSLPCCSLKMFV